MNDPMEVDHAAEKMAGPSATQSPAPSSTNTIDSVLVALGKMLLTEKPDEVYSKNAPYPTEAGRAFAHVTATRVVSSMRDRPCSGEFLLIIFSLHFSRALRFPSQRAPQRLIREQAEILDLS
jgi:hypothetical protein